jgi:type IV secretion system protein VirD4
MNRRALGIAVLIIILWAACSWLASALFISLALHAFTNAAPWTIYHYTRYYGHVPGISRLISVSWFLSASVFITALALLLRQRKASPYGDARWARERDIRKAGLRSDSGLLLGRFNHEFLVAGGFEHVLCFAPTRSGKGVGIVIPNLLNWPGSVIVHDIKGENFEKTSGFRARHGQKVFFWNPGDPEGRTHCYNPLEFISDKPGRRIDDIQKIAHLILPEQEFWTNEARTLFVGLSLHLIEKSPLSFGVILRALRGAGNFVEDLKQLLQAERESMNPVAYMALNAFVQKADKEQSAVLSTLNAALELWANPLIDAATARSDFDLRLLRRESTTIYVGVAPSNLHRLRPLMQIFYQQAIDMMTEHQPDPSTEPYPVLFLMDEFPSLGRMTQFEQGVAYLAGYQVRLLLIIQDIPQLEASYGRSGMNLFMGNSKLRITFASNNVDTAELISRFIGTYGADLESESRSRQMGLSLQPGYKSASQSQVPRALLLPQEILQLSPDEEIILVEGAPPIRARKIRYFKEAVFGSRLLPAASVPKVNPLTPTVPSLCDVKPLTDSEQEECLNEDPQEEEISASH